MYEPFTMPTDDFDKEHNHLLKQRAKFHHRNYTSDIPINHGDTTYITVGQVYYDLTYHRMCRVPANKCILAILCKDTDNRPTYVACSACSTNTVSKCRVCGI